MYYKLPDCPEKRRLIMYLEKQIEECDEKAYINEGTILEDEYRVRETAYRDILDKIR